MLILVLGTLGSKVTYFIEKYLQEIPGYGPSAKYRLFIQPSRKDFTDLNIEKLVFTHRYLTKELGYNHIIIESMHDGYLTPNIRTNANFIIFTDLNAFERYFCRDVDSPVTVSARDILRARTCVESKAGIVIWNVSENKFKHLQITELNQ